MPLFFVVGAVSQYVGAAIGVWLFATTEPATVAWLRALGAAVVLLAWRRPWRGPGRGPGRGRRTARWTRRSVGVAAAFGVVTLAMNVAFYEAIARIPLGTAVAIEFTGPIAVALLGSRRALDYLAAALVGAGVYLVAGVQSGVDAVGVAFALLAAALWAGYIVLGKRVADAGAGLDSLAVGMAVAAAASAPVLLATQAAVDASVLAEPRTWLWGAGIGLLSSAIPYALDQPVLATIGRARFALLLALLPATAAVVGAVALAQRPNVAEAAGIAAVMAALAVSARAARGRTGDSGTIEP
ncbi:EamA family transporter [Mycolicibacterium sp. 3033]|nr:EamA family transporter [Mycolicibacterium aurantiacum]